MPHSAHAPAYREFLKRLRAARAKSGLKQEDVARRLRKPQSYVSKCESGERRVDVIELSAFAAIYGVPITVFVPTSQRRQRSR